MNNRERKRKSAQEHNRKYYAKKARLSSMSTSQIEQEKIAQSVALATSELIPQANQMITGKENA